MRAREKEGQARPSTKQVKHGQTDRQDRRVSPTPSSVLPVIRAVSAARDLHTCASFHSFRFPFPLELGTRCASFRALLVAHRRADSC